MSSGKGNVQFGRHTLSLCTYKNCAHCYECSMSCNFFSQTCPGCKVRLCNRICYNKHVKECDVVKGWH